MLLDSSFNELIKNFENISITGKSVFLTSNYLYDHDTATISSTIINGSSSALSTIFISSTTDTSMVINGFTITGGSGTSDYGAYLGGGIYLKGLRTITSFRMG